MIGITATIPIEIIFAAGRRPVDLNNLFITSSKPDKLVAQAESAGFPHSICSWIKGIYSVVIGHEVKEVIAVTGGDCSNTIALAELLARRGVKVIPFEYPLTPNREALMAEMERLVRGLSTDWPAIERIRSSLEGV
ncbi:MAG TPA: 2-hydroxyacyl-CoA dehydratase, partial [Acidobacteriota bacterium]|nr:2-hydroxyacyl-CoA dehydratase [Acidobacteriota bacterium]